MKISIHYVIPVLTALACQMTLVGNSQASELSRGAILGNACASCHGTDGRSPGSIPSINGKSAEFIETALLDFKSGKRPSTVMQRHAKGYSDEDIKLIAEYFASRQ